MFLCALKRVSLEEKIMKMTPALQLLEVLVPYETVEKISINSLEVIQKGRYKKLNQFKFSQDEDA